MSNLAATESRSSDATDLSKGADAKLEYQPGLPGIIEDSDLQGDDVDEAAAALRGQSLDYTEQEESRVVSKIDWRMMPIMAITCGLQFVDKSAVSNAATFGLQSDLHLHGQNYSWAVSVFYFSYLGATWPSTYLLQRFHPGKVIGIACVLWGVCILAMLGVTNFGGLIACRFLLGVFEAPLSPGFMMITTRWYTQKEQPFRFGLWTLLNGWLPIPALVMFYGLGHAGGPLQPWRYIFLVLGLVTVLMGVIVFFFIADSPANAPFLNDRERAIAVERIARCQTGIKNTQWKREQFMEALTDPRVWLVVATLFLSQSGGAVTTNFIGIIIKGFGYNQLRSLLLQTPAFAIQGFICLIVTGLVSFTKTFRNLKQPLLSIAACCVIAGTGVVYSTTPTAQNRQLLLGMMYMIALNNCSFTTIMSVIGVNFAGATKKSTVSAMTFVAYCVSNIVVPQAFRGTEAPTYHSGILTVMCFQIALVICYWASWALMTLENKRRDKLQARHPHPDGEKGVDGAMQKKEDVLQGLKDLTDRENMTFRYSP
ncbi:major facilitator superfamily domain-containing protein [Roridomyces roridus]|uniref:Major facilitator superfamily domain-containing protein n=1 Tax=Roridomyces roridus TaxID=1738132 RepID=A0AAD7FFT6_9AGAR|nr:major facilitator superfamily domain-containing protein [Roridomyces roridus]